MSEADESRDPTSPDLELSTNVLFGLLRDSRRRDVLRYLLASPGDVSLDELSAAIASRGNPPSDQRIARVSIDLHHVHLPKLADAGVVRYDPDSEVVEPLALPADLEARLDFLVGDDRFGYLVGDAG